MAAGCHRHCHDLHVIGALGAIMQTDIKRLMAYSSIAHMGYALVGMASALPEGISSVMVYMAIYMATAIGIFALILTFTRDGTSAMKISDLAGYSRSHPVQAAGMLIFMFSMADSAAWGFLRQMVCFQLLSMLA